MSIGIGGDGTKAVPAMWVLTAVAFVFVILRTYTRLVVVRGYGIDDYVYTFAFFLLFLYALFMTLSAMHGFGQNMWDIPDAEDRAKAMFWQAMGQTAAVFGMAVAKWSLGLFLLRIAETRWNFVAIWAAMLILMGTSISTAFVFWLQVSTSNLHYCLAFPLQHSNITLPAVSNFTSRFRRTGLDASCPLLPLNL